MAEVASAFVSIIPSARGFGSKLDGQIGPEINKSGKKSGISFGKLFAAGAALGIGAKGISFLGDSLDEARESQKVSALVVNAIKATGGAANVTAKQVDRLATSISRKTGIDDEQIAMASSLILTFKNVANEGRGVNAIFDRTTKAAVDLSAAGFGSVDSAAKQLGKALNDPIKGMAALSRSGVTFSESQQAQIKGFVETGNLLKAQKLILAEVNSQVGGAAAATATESAKAAVAAGNLKEQIGTALLPVVDSLANTFTTKVAPAISRFVAGMSNGTGAGGRFAAVLKSTAAVLGSLTGFINRNRAAVGTFVAIVGTAIAITKAYRVAQVALNIVLIANPIGLVVVAIAALAAGLVIAYRRSETFRNIVDGAFGAVKSSAKSLAGFITEKIPAAFNAVVQFVKGIPGKIVAVFAGASTLLYNAGAQLMSGLAAGIRAKISDAIAEVASGLSRIRDMLPGSPIKDGPLKPWNSGRPGEMLMEFLAKGIAKGGAKMRKAMTSELDQLKGTLETLKSDFTSLAESVAGAFTGDLFGVTATEADAAAGIAGSSVGQNFIAGLTAKKGELAGLLASFKTLAGWGIPASFLSQLFASGNGALITELAGMGQAGATSAASLFGEVTDLGAQLGGAVATNDYGPNIDKTTAEIKELRKDIEALPKKQGRETAEALANTRIVIEGGDAGQRAYFRTGR